MPRLTRPRLTGISLVFAAALGCWTGCAEKEKVVDIETPRRDIEVERNLDTGEVDVDVERKE